MTLEELVAQAAAARQAAQDQAASPLAELAARVAAQRQPADLRPREGETREQYQARLAAARTSVQPSPGSVELTRMSERALTGAPPNVDMSAPPIQINGQWHPAGTTPDMIANMPAGFMYDPSTGQYRNPREDAARMDRSAMDAAIGGGMQGVSLGAGDEILGGIATATQGPAQGALYTEQVRAALDQDREQRPLASILGEIGGAVLLPGAAYKAGAGWLSNIARAAGVGAGMGGGYAFNTGEGGLADRAARVPVGAALGAIGGAVAVPVAAGLNRLGSSIGNFVRNRRLFNNGQLTDTGRRVLLSVGVDPDQVGPDFQAYFAQQAARVADPNDARALAELNEFGIPAMRPNVTGSVDDFATLARVERVGQGPAAESVRTAIAAQRDAMRRAAENIATDMGGGIVADQGDAAAAVMQGLRAAQDNARTTAQGAYRALEAAGGGLRGTAVANLADDVGARLNALGQRLSDQLTPNAQAALDDIRQMVSGAERGAVPFMSIERIRQNLVRLRSNAYRGTLGQDQRAVDELIQVFDARVDDLLTTAMTEGDPNVIKGLAEGARNLWSQYRQTFMGRDAGSRFIQRMIDEDASPDQAVRWLFSAGKLGSSPFTANIARQVRDVLGPDSEQWNAIRQAAFRQLTMRAEGVAQPGPQQIAKSISEFINGSATRDLSRTIFSGDEIALMGRFAGALRRLVPPDGAVNYSNTAYESARMVRNVFQALSAALGYGATGGTPGGALVGAAAMNAVQNGMNNAGIRQLLQSAPARTIQSSPTGFGAVGVNALALPTATGLSPFRPE